MNQPADFTSNFAAAYGAALDVCRAESSTTVRKAADAAFSHHAITQSAAAALVSGPALR